MNPKVRADLVDLIARMYGIQQLDTLVRKVLNRSLEYYVALADRVTTVDKLIAALELTPEDLELLLVNLRVWTRAAALRAAIDAYYGAPAGDDPYNALMVLDEPFVDRQKSRDKLRDLFQNPNRRALVVRGVPATGKSHSRWLIEHVARSEGIEPVFVQLKDNVLDDVVAQIINDLSLPPHEFRDRLAQASTITKGFLSALRGSARKMLLGERWCLIFDSHDYDIIPKAIRDFVDELLADVANLQMPPIWMVVLGHRPPPPNAGQPPLTRLITDDILPMTPPDVDKFLQQLCDRNGKSLRDGQSFTFTEAIFQDLTPPLDHEKMAILALRLRETIAQIEGG